jgi:predicted enzyme related to lactoylglutathione lyase
MPIGEVLAVTIDCADPALLARFWMAVAGGEIDPRTESGDWVALRNVPNLGNLGFQKVPESKAVKNRVHLDVEVADMGSAVAAAVSAGATVNGTTVEEPTNWFTVLLDPEGNEFCLVVRRR